MHVSLLIAAAASLAVTRSEPARVIPPAPTANDGTPCVPLSRHARGKRGSGTWREFDGTNPPVAYLAVDRRVNGCPVPVYAGGARRR